VTHVAEVAETFGRFPLRSKLSASSATYISSETLGEFRYWTFGASRFPLFLCPVYRTDALRVYEIESRLSPSQRS